MPISSGCTANCTRAASPFDGTWVDDLSSQVAADHADVYLVADGAYRCDSCAPPRAYPADGKPRQVPGDPETLSESVAVAGPRTIVTRIVSAEMVRETTMTVADDDKTATYVALDQWPGLAERLRTEYLARRVAQTPAGAHPVSGSWLAVRYVQVPEAYRSITLRDSGDGLSRSNFRHGRYTAKYGGPPVPLQGLSTKGDFTVTVSKPDERTRVETIRLNGKPVVERTFRLSPDGQTMETAARDPASGEVFRITSHRK